MESKRRRELVVPGVIVKVIHGRLIDYDGCVQNRGGLTVAGVCVSGLWYGGYALCSPSDNFRKRHGRNIAVGRAKAAARKMKESLSGAGVFEAMCKLGHKAWADLLYRFGRESLEFRAMRKLRVRFGGSGHMPKATCDDCAMHGAYCANDGPHPACDMGSENYASVRHWMAPEQREKING